MKTRIIVSIIMLILLFSFIIGQKLLFEELGDKIDALFPSGWKAWILMFIQVILYGGTMLVGIILLKYVSEWLMDKL